MPKSYFYCVHLLIKNESHLQRAITSVTAEEAFFLKNVQLILIDSVCSEQTMSICDEYRRKYPDNVFFVDAAGKNEAAAYNDAKMLCFGTYVCYMDNYGEYDKKMWSALQRKLQPSDTPILCLEPVTCMAGTETRIYEKTESGSVDLKNKPDRLILVLGCYLFHRSITETMLFDEQLSLYTEVKFIIEALLHTYSYLFTDSYHYAAAAPSDHDWFKYVPQYSRRFYTPCLQEMVIPMLMNYPGSVLVQSAMLYLIESRFALNQDERYKHVIIGSFVDEFMDKVSETLKYIDDAVILNRNICRRCGLDEEMSFRLLRLKYKQPDLQPQIDFVLPKETLEKSYYRADGRLTRMTLQGEFVAHHDLAMIGTSREISAEIVIVNYDTDGLYIDAVLNGCSYLDEKEFSLFVNVNGNRSPVIRSEVYTLKKYFDIPFLKRFAFRFFVPVSSGKTMDSIFLMMRYRNLSFRIGMTFNGIFSRLSSSVKSSYWHFLDRVMLYDRKTRSLVIRRATNSLLHINESKFLAEAGQSLPLSEQLYYRQLRKSIRSMKAEKTDSQYLLFYGETGMRHNGPVLFRYFSKHKDNDKIEVFFSAKGGSEEQDCLLDAEYDNVLESGSKKAKLIAACADIIFATDCDVYESLLFSEKDILFLKDLLNAKIVSIKDFFITYGTAQFDNRLRDNMQLFFCSSEKEKEHILRNVYDFNDAMVRVTGYPMLDTLSDAKEKLILLAPGDRRQFCIYENSDFYRFTNSRFFKLYNNILTDPRLHTALQEKGYRIAVMLPYTIEKFLPLFTADDVIQLYPCNTENETELVKKASVLITDYADLQFRFAFLNKPVLYYYPQGLPIRQEFKAEGLAKNSFGKLFFEHDKLIDHLIQEMETDFPQPVYYEKAAGTFFRYHDSHNCQRIFTAVKNTFLSKLYS